MAASSPPSTVDHDNVKTWLIGQAQAHGFTKTGFAKAQTLPVVANQLKTWLATGQQGNMEWMTNRASERADIHTYHPTVRTVVSLAMNYYVPRPASEPGVPQWSNYAWGSDYHKLIKKRLKAILGALVEQFPGVGGIGCVDTSPVMEKAWAQQAGIGWQGKNTLLISRDHGSYLFLAELLLDVELEPDDPYTDDLCGSCRACLDACPTKALIDANHLDARKCISYLNIEHTGEFDSAQSAMLVNWLYGCDICQQVCPWNIRFARDCGKQTFQPREHFTSYTLERWAGLTWDEWDILFRNSPARHTGLARLQRNARALQANEKSASRNS